MVLSCLSGATNEGSNLFLMDTSAHQDPELVNLDVSINSLTVYFFRHL